MTPEVSHAPMSSLKDAAAALQELHPEATQNKSDMSVTPRVPHREMCPYVSSAEALSESHAATAVRMLVSSRGTVGTGVTLGAAVVGSGVGFVGMAEVGIGVGVYEGVAVVGTADVVGSDDGRDDGMGDGKEVVGSSVGRNDTVGAGVGTRETVGANVAVGAWDVVGAGDGQAGSTKT